MVTLLDLFSENDQIKKWHQNLTDKKKTTNARFVNVYQGYCNCK